MRVLVVDDDPGVQGMLKMVLELEGLEVELAGDGRQALAAIEGEPPDAIVLDIMMPELDGWGVAEALAADERWRAIPIVFCTAMTGADETWRGWQLGAASYVPKPFDTQQLVDEVLRVVGTSATAT